MTEDPAAAPPGVDRPWASPVARRRIAEIQQQAELGGDEELALARAASASVHTAMSDGLLLYAGTNAPLEAAIAADDAELGIRGTTGDPGEVAKPGMPALHGIDTLEVLAGRAVGAGFGAPFVDVRPQSATLANLAAYAAMAPPGATIGALPEAGGGHFSHHEHGAAGIRGLRVETLPWDGERQDVDLEALPAFLDRHEPRMLVIGGSVQLFPNDVAAVAELADRAGARLLFDASHPAGLIAGGALPNPLDEGAAAVTFSTYKSYGGPPGGAVVSRDAALAAAIFAAVFPGLTANYDASRLRPLLIAARALLAPGSTYAADCVATARALAGALDAEGLAVMAAARGFTATNQVLVRIAEREAATAIVESGAEAGVYLSATTHCDEQGQSPALRLGTQELVRRGYRVEQMEEVARLIAQLVRGGASPLVLRGQLEKLRPPAAAA